MFNTGFQSSVPIAKSMEYAVGALTANRDFLQDLQKELDGKVMKTTLTTYYLLDGVKVNIFIIHRTVQPLTVQYSTVQYST